MKNTKTVRLAALAASLVAAIGVLPASGQDRPANVRADRTALERAYGADLANRVFSHALTGQLQTAIQASSRQNAGFVCGERPNVALISVIPWRGMGAKPAWIERFAVQCQPELFRNFLMFEDGDEIRIREMAPGTSNTDPLLQRDLMQGIAAASVRLRPPGCSDAPTILNVRMVREQSPAQGSWRETWDVSVCGRKAEIPVAFAPSARGGTTWTIERAP